MVNEKKITKEMNIVETIQKYPDTASVLMESGMHCLGCAAAKFESLEQGLAAHGKSEKEIEETIDKMNEVVDKSEE